MPILRTKEINNMSSEDRAQKLSELRAELARLRTMVRAGGAVENPARIRGLRKTIAQILTIENESKLGLRSAAEEPAKKVEKTRKTKVKEQKSE
jgi:large subunit ribosomal protein L29